MRRPRRLRPRALASGLAYALALAPGLAAGDGIMAWRDGERRGAATVTVTEGTNLAAAVAPTGTTVIALQGRLYRLGVKAPDAVALTGLFDDAWEPAITTDAGTVVYQGYRSGNWDLWGVASDGSAEPERLTDSPFDDREPDLAGDGHLLAFSSDRGGAYDIWTLDLRDRTLRRITREESDQYAPAISATGRFAWIETGPDGNQIVVADSAGGNRRVVLETGDQPAGLAWHPGGEALSFQVGGHDAAGNGVTSMQILTLASGLTQTISASGADVFPFRGSWTDADTLVYTADGVVVTWRRGADTTREHPFAVPVALDRPDYPRRRRDHDDTGERRALGISTPALAPDGERVAFTALGDLWLWTPSSNSLEQLTDDASAQQTPAWSPDGARLAYVDDRGGEVGLWTIDPVGRVRERVPVPYEVISYPAWSPDGKRFAFFTDVAGNPLLHVVGQLTVFEPATGRSTRLLKPMPPQPIAWSPDGTTVMTVRLAPYTRRFREGVYEIVMVDAAGGDAHAIVPVAHRNVTNATLAPAGDAVAYTQDGVLNVQPLDPTLRPAGPPRVVVDALADSPHWGGGDQIVFQQAESLKRLHLPSGAVSDITPTLRYRRDNPTDEWVLRAGRLFDGTGTDYQRNVDIHIRGHRVHAIGPIDRSTKLEVVDASDRAVIPGLFESHTHMGDNSLSEVQGRVWLAYGITSVRDPGSNPYLSKERQEAWDSGRRIGPRTYLTAHNIDGPRVYYAVVEGITSDAHLERALDRARRMDMDFLKTYVRLPDAQQRRVVEFGHAHGMPVTSHELLPAAAFGVDHIEHIGGTSRRGYATKTSTLGRSYQDVRAVLTASGMGMVPTMVVPGVVLTFDQQADIYETPQFDAFYGESARQTYVDFMQFFGRGAESVVDAYGELLKTLIDGGALVGTGTDSPFTPFGTGLHAELRLYARAGIAPHAILHAATHESAVIAGVENDLGAIAPGKLADLVVIDGDPLADIADADNVVMTVKNGRRYPIKALLPAPLD